jgi:glycosyltransferase involved in cell wall biosynthesis
MNNQFMKKKKLIFTVTNELNYDQRMQRICGSLADNGYDVCLIGWYLKGAKKLDEKNFTQKRLPLFFQKGKLRYVETNIKLFFFLLFQNFDLVGAIDLDTVLPCLLASKIRRKKIIYDAHEYFTELEEIVRRPIIKKIWTWIEKFSLPQIQHGYTISASYAQLFKEKYGVNYEVVSNIAVLKNDGKIENKSEKFILYQGAVGEGRALFQLVDAMENVNAKLMIYGHGNVFEKLKFHISQKSFQNKIELKGFVKPEELKKITPLATVGITLFETNGLSNYYSLANRFFDYMHACIPQLCNAYPEYIKINNEFQITELIEKPDVLSIQNALNKIINDEKKCEEMIENCKQARLKYNWQNEEKQLLNFYNKIFSNTD